MKIIKNKKEALEQILNQELVAIFQGHSEWGPRALGNRSLLFDPRNIRAKEIVNEIKGRQWWRPTAATVLFEYKDEWFDFATLPESPYMTFAVDAKEKAIHETASIVHVNKTCRVQTLKREQNPHYYDLIMEYYKETQVPLLLNTSFNLAGFPLVESINDALYTLINSKIKYLYTPENTEK